jgi:serine/threonine protein kinase
MSSTLPFDVQPILPALAAHGYDYIADIGSGAQGVVYLCISRRDQREYAVKVGRTTVTAPELEILKSVCHPNVIYIYETFVESGYLFMVLEYCPGGSIADLALAGPIPCDLLYTFTEQVFHALQACHDAKIAHGDLKPQNILMNNNGRAKLVDFGLAQVHQGDLSIQFKGSFAYLAPEVVRQDPFDPFKADVWSLGVTLYGMAAGKLPWPENLPRSAFQEYISQGLREVDPVIPPDFANLLRHMIVADPAERPSLDQIDLNAFLPKGKVQISKKLGRGTRGRGLASAASCMLPEILVLASLRAPCLEHETAAPEDTWNNGKRAGPPKLMKSPLTTSFSRGKLLRGPDATWGELDE